jgi:hypothetical protein
MNSIDCIKQIFMQYGFCNIEIKSNKIKVCIFDKLFFIVSLNFNKHIFLTKVLNLDYIKINLHNCILIFDSIDKFKTYICNLSKFVDIDCIICKISTLNLENNCNNLNTVLQKYNSIFVDLESDLESDIRKDLESDIGKDIGKDLESDIGKDKFTDVKFLNLSELNLSELNMPELSLPESAVPITTKKCTIFNFT